MTHTDFPIYPLLILGDGGQISFSMAPGRKDRRWNRDLTQDIAALVGHRVSVVLCLLEWSELNKLHLLDYPSRLQATGITFYHLPVADNQAPAVKELAVLVPAIISHWQQGIHVLVHCRAGLGRSGLFVACCLVYLGYTADQAISLVRNERRKAIQTVIQEQCILAYSQYLSVA